MAEEAQTFSRLPTLMTALDISHGGPTLGGPPEMTKSEDEARPGYGLTESMLSQRTGLLKRLLKNFKRKGGKNTQCEHTDGIPSLTLTTGDSLRAEGGNTAGNASESKNDRKSLPRVLRDCHNELHSLSKKLETKNVKTSRKEALAYAFKQSKVNMTVKRLQRFQQQIVVALSIDQMCADDNQRRQDIYQRRQDVYKWLAAPDYESKHLNAAGEWEKNTGSWVLQGGSFHEWKTQPKSFLWLHGKAGSGKTVLCSTIIRALSGHSKSNPSIAVAFFYFDFRSKDIEPHSLLRALIKQLSLKSTKTFNYELKSTLEFIIGTFEENVYIIFDALDECPDRHKFLELMKEIHGWDFDTLHLLATSRDEQDIETTLQDLVSHQVSMDEGLVDNNIQLSKYSAEKKETIKNTLMDGAHGMFRWVVCQLDALRKCRSPYELRKTLTNLPKTLYETYDRILLDIDESNREYALKLLQWLAFSVDPVSLRLAVEVLATDPDAKTGPLFDPERRFDDPRDILTLCSSLVSVTTVTDDILWYPEYIKDGQGKFTELRLAHFSVREYLVSECLRTHSKLSIYHCDEPLANTFIAKTCVAYLLQFNQHCITQDIWISHPLCSYAAEYWIRHTQPDNDDDSTLHHLIMSLLQPESVVYSNWLELYPRNQWSGKRAPIQYTAEAGLAILSRDLLENGADANAQGGKWGNALQAALSEGHHLIVELLLEKGADVNAQGRQYGNVLQAASLWGHLPTVELLLEKGADINAQGGEYGNALQAASSWGPYATV
ncbi:hypothetical protein JB92DRAFT_3118991 [Gautieria morchelliformis]|nr:hypothetical protein JB92DRAFT_3118991 [Gautieria morchelliformis]